jgi:fumarate reductase subunit D
MAVSNKPIVWGPFAAGGTVTAFVTPVLVLLTLLAGLGNAPELLAYDRIHAVAGHWLFKLAAAGVVFLSLWSAAHRLRITCYDLGVRVYAVALAGTAASVIYLARI